MPVHDWTRVEAGIFHDFLHEWISENKRAINRRLRGTGYYALAEQFVSNYGPDVLALQRPFRGPKPEKRARKPRDAGVALTDAPPKLRFHLSHAPFYHLKKKKVVSIRHISDHRVVAVLEIVSPGNKAGRSALAALVDKAQDLIAAGIHLAIIDLFPPSKRDPNGLHPLIWGETDNNAYHFDSAKPLTCASYVGGFMPQAFVEPVAVGDALPVLPLFLTPDEYLDVRLEDTYMAAFDAVPDYWRDVLTKSKR